MTAVPWSDVWCSEQGDTGGHEAEDTINYLQSDCLTKGEEMWLRKLR